MLPCLVGIGRTFELPNPRKYISTCQNKNGCLPTPQSIEPHSPTQHLFLEIIYLFSCLQISTERPSPNNSDIQMSVLGGREGAVFIFSFHYIFSLHSIFLRSVGSLQGTIRNENPTKTWRNVCWIRETALGISIEFPSIQHV